MGSGLTAGCPSNIYCAPLAYPSLAGNTIVAFAEFTSALTVTATACATFACGSPQSMTAVGPTAAVSSREGEVFYLPCATTGTSYVKFSTSGTGAVQHVFVDQIAGLPCSSTLRASNTATNGTASATITGGSITPTSGDFIMLYGCRAGTPGAGINFVAGTGQSGITWTLWDTDNRDGCANQWGTWSGSGAFTPQMTSASGTSTVLGVALDFATSTTQGTDPTGMYVAKALEVNTTITQTAGKTVSYQLPNIGNLTMLQFGCGNYSLNPASPPTGTNTWVVLGQNIANNAGTNTAVAQNASVDNTGSVSVPFVVAPATAAGDCDGMFYDIVGAPTSNAVTDRWQSVGNQTSGGNLTYTSTYMPAASSGLQFARDSHGADTAFGCNAPSSCQFIVSSFGGISRDGPALPSQNNFAAIGSNSSNSAQTWTAVTADSTEGFGLWTFETVTLAAPGATLGVFSSPTITGTCSPNCTVTSAAIKTTNTVKPAIASGVLTVFVGWDGGGTMSCADGTNGTYTAVDSPVSGAATGGLASVKFQTFWVANTTISAVTVTCTESGGTPTASGSWMAVQYLEGVTTLDQHPAIKSTLSQTSPCLSNTTSTTTAANEVVVSGVAVGTSIQSAPNNLTAFLMDSGRSFGYAAGALTVGATGTQQASWVEDTSPDTCSVSINTFK